MTKYTIADFRKEFPTERACLDYIFRKKYPDLKQYYFVEGRKCYANTKGQQIHPVKGTIFEKSSTPLTLWFYAIYLFSTSKNGVAAKELQRQLGVTYKTAWRMARQIRALMSDKDGEPLTGTVEIDEAYYGGHIPRGHKVDTMKNKSVIVGAVERRGRVKAKVSPNAKAKRIGDFIDKNVNPITSRLMSDESNRYVKTLKGYDRQSVNHHLLEYVRGEVHTNTIEGFWSQLKRSMDGTYHAVSKKYLQSYVDEFSFRRNHPSVFEAMVARI